MKIRSERGREALYIGCVYMPTDSTSVVMENCYEMLKEDVLRFREKGKVVLLGDLNARVGRSAQIDDVIGMFEENTCNASGNRLHFVGISDSKESLQKLIDVVYSYCSKWRLRANVSKSAVMVFSKDAVNGCWKWGEYSLPIVSSCSYLVIDFSRNGAWDMHIRKLLDNGRKRVNQLHKVISNRNINLSARRQLLLSVIRPSIEYGSEVWEGNKSQAGSLESIILDGAKRILGCSSKTCNEAVRGDMGLDTLQSRRDRAKLKWWYKLATLPEDRYPKQLFNQEWNIKPHRRRRKVWSRMVDELFKSLDIDKSEWLEDSKHGDSSSASFMACVEECIIERESRKF